MGVDPATASLVAGGLGLAGSLFGADKASDAASKAAGSQKALLQRQTALFDAIFNAVQQADRSGFFNPDVRIAEAKGDLTRQTDTAMANTAGALKVAGYKPGDTAIEERIGTIARNSALQFSKVAQGIRDSSLMNKLSAYGMANPGTLNPGISAYGQQAQMAQGRADAITGQVPGLVGSMMPYLFPQRAGVQATPSVPSSNYLPPLTIRGFSYSGA